MRATKNINIPRFKKTNMRSRDFILLYQKASQLVITKYTVSANIGSILVKRHVFDS